MGFIKFKNLFRERNQLTDNTAVMVFNLELGLIVFLQSLETILQILHDNLDGFLVPRIVVVFFMITKKIIKF